MTRKADSMQADSMQVKQSVLPLVHLELLDWTSQRRKRTLRKTTPPQTTVHPCWPRMAAAALTKLHFTPLVRPSPRPCEALGSCGAGDSSRVDQVSCRERVFQSREQSDPHGSQFGS